MSLSQYFTAKTLEGEPPETVLCLYDDKGNGTYLDLSKLTGSAEQPVAIHIKPSPSDGVDITVEDLPTQADILKKLGVFE